MPILTHPDCTLLLNALSQSPLFATVRARQALLRNTLAGYPQSDAVLAILPQINLEDAPFLAADNVILYLDGQQLAPGVPALGLLAQAIEPFSGPLREPLTQLRHRLLPAATTIAPQPAATWNDLRSPTDLTQERIIGENTLRPLFYLRRALRAADAVVRIDLDHTPHGTGFLLAPGLVMTNNHVIATAAQAQRAQAIFFDELPDAEAPATEPPRPTVSAQPATESPVLCTNESLDFTLLRFANTPALPRYLPLRTAIPKPNDRVAIIQHAAGGQKRISLQNNLVAHADTRVVQYYTSTLPGSSGSPVFDDAFAVVAIHRGSVELAGPDRNAKSPEAMFYRNQGIVMHAIVDYLRTHHPALLGEITVREE